MKKKLLSLLLALCLVMALVPMTAFAEGTSVDNWDGSADTSWYTSAPDASEYHISTAEQLAGLAQLVNTDPGTTNFAGKTFYLENDLDLSGHEWISIGTVLGGDYPEYSFCGVFDGQGHVISNLYSHESYIEGADESHNLLRNALFGSVYNGEVKNLGVANAEICIIPLGIREIACKRCSRIATGNGAALHGNTNDTANILFYFGAAVNTAGCPAVRDFGLTHPVN